MKTQSIFGKIWLSLVVVSCFVCFSIASCNEQQQLQIDKLANNVQGIAQGTQAVINTPAGDLVSPSTRVAIESVSAIAMGLVIAWRSYRAAQAQTAVKEIVTGIEKVKPCLCAECLAKLKAEQYQSQKTLSTSQEVLAVKFNNNI
jgi:hypothetical protein